uniref:Uncharacterized protein n=1 Tax=Setaria viridis TaxID=4556 RepID=A0A4U6VFY5_SETVI|nr:hypothetical protein SEVIR_4G268100v2 [Setaria viridis]
MYRVFVSYTNIQKYGEEEQPRCRDNVVVCCFTFVLATLGDTHRRAARRRNGQTPHCHLRLRRPPVTTHPLSLSRLAVSGPRRHSGHAQQTSIAADAAGRVQGSIFQRGGVEYRGLPTTHTMPNLEEQLVVVFPEKSSQPRDQVLRRVVATRVTADHTHLRSRLLLQLMRILFFPVVPPT